MAKQTITSKDVIEYYSKIFGGRRQFEGMRIDSGKHADEIIVIEDLQHDFKCEIADVDYYKASLNALFKKFGYGDEVLLQQK